MSERTPIEIPTPDHLPHLVPADEVGRRLDAFRAMLRTRDIAFAWVDHLTDRLYLAGTAQSGVLIVPADGEAVLWARKSIARAEAEAKVAVRPHPGRRKLHDEFKARAGARPAVGLAADVTTAATLQSLGEALEGAEFVDISGELRRQRATKSAWEIAQVRHAAAQANAALTEVASRIRPGASELELTAFVEGRMRVHGHGGTIRVRRAGADVVMAVVVSGDTGLYPTNFDGCVGGGGPTPANPGGGGARKLAAGDTVMFDIVSAHNGYHADTTRTFFVGKTPPPPVLAAHRFCVEILRELERLMVPGAICQDIWRTIDAEVARRGAPPGFMGHGENRVRFFGHGVGLELDELPVIADRVEIALAPGMVIAVEPKAFLPGVGPVGVENTYVIGAKGAQSLCRLDDDLSAAG